MDSRYFREAVIARALEILAGFALVAGWLAIAIWTDSDVQGRMAERAVEASTIKRAQAVIAPALSSSAAGIGRERLPSYP